jgi:hypothetical protein
MGARNRVGIWLSYRPARLQRLAELIPWNRFLGSLNVYKFRLSSMEMASFSRSVMIVFSARRLAKGGVARPPSFILTPRLALLRHLLSKTSEKIATCIFHLAPLAFSPHLHFWPGLDKNIKISFRGKTISSFLMLSQNCWENAQHFKYKTHQSV